MSKSSLPARDGGFTTVAPIVAAPVATIAPEFLRLPTGRNVEPLSGLRRSQLYNLIAERKIQAISLRPRGKARGTRLLVAQSVRNYLHGLAIEQNPPQTITQ